MAKYVEGGRIVGEGDVDDACDGDDAALRSCVAQLCVISSKR
jgi:hypothetical protein